MNIEIWSDVVCPWCYIGKRRFERAVASFSHPGEVTVNYRSFELDPSAPAERSGTHAERLAGKYGMTIAQAEQASQQMTQRAAADGLEFRFDLIRGGNTFDAHRLLHLAKDHGLQPEMKERLMRATFTEGLPIADKPTLARLAVEAGLPASAGTGRPGWRHLRRRGASRRAAGRTVRHHRRAVLRRRRQVRGQRRTATRGTPAAPTARLRRGKPTHARRCHDRQQRRSELRRRLLRGQLTRPCDCDRIQSFCPADDLPGGTIPSHLQAGDQVAHARSSRHTPLRSPGCGHRARDPPICIGKGQDRTMAETAHSGTFWALARSRGRRPAAEPNQSMTFPASTRRQASPRSAGTAGPGSKTVKATCWASFGSGSG